MDEKLDHENLNKLSSILQLLNQIVKDGFILIGTYKYKFDEVLKVPYAQYTLRSIYCFESIKCLLEGFLSKKFYREFSISILLRSGLLDYLTILYLKSFYTQINQEQSIFESSYYSELEKLLTNQIFRMLKFTMSNKAELPDELYNKYIDTIYEDNYFLFAKKANYNNPIESLRYNKGFITNPKILERLKKCENEIGRAYISVYNLYDEYSKYDHFGLHGVKYQRLNINTLFGNILKSLFFTSDGLKIALSFINEQCIENEVKMISNNCESIKKIIIK